MKNISFTNTIDEDPIFLPKPAKNALPEWYKKTFSYIYNENANGIDLGTIKKCMPVFDSMTAGYILFTPVEILVKNIDGLPYYQWPKIGIEFHPIEQAPLHPKKNNAPYPKWINPWAIKTPTGYSCLFLPPMHHSNDIFTILPGVVDTDKYTSPVNFPFTLNDVSWQGMIPAGTPMAQVIPFKRDSWKMNIGSKEEYYKKDNVIEKLKCFFYNSYKKQFWSQKKYD